MKYSELNSANSYLFTLEWRKYFWLFHLFGSFILDGCCLLAECFMIQNKYIFILYSRMI